MQTGHATDAPNTTTFVMFDDMATYTDVHHHMLTPGLVGALEKHGVHTIGGEPFPSWKPEASLEIMDRVGIQCAVLSTPIPLDLLDTGAETMARELNDYAADCMSRWPDRFGFFASLPLPDVDATVREAVRVLDESGASGVLMLSNHAGVYQGDRVLDPLYDTLNRRRAVVFVHPTACHSPIPVIQPSQLEFGFDATRTVANLLINSVPQRFPDIRFVFTHSASCVPSVAHKLIDRRPIVAAYTAYVQQHGTPRPVDNLLDELATAESSARNQIAGLYFDTALSTSAPVLDALTSLVPTSHIMFGTDFPFGHEIGLQYTLRGIERYPGFSDTDRAAVLGANANALLRLDTPATPWPSRTRPPAAAPR
jgi:6-methylsalicylate decarboxylase